MATRKLTLSTPKPQRFHPRKVLPIRSASAWTIMQRDLVELELLRQEAAEAAEALRAKRDFIRRELEAGATIEPGLRRAEIKTRKALIFQ
jgi:hypothetical protein